MDTTDFSDKNLKDNEAVPLVSIIVMSYKNLKYYQECLQSVFRQTYPRLELIISDDGTPDFNREEIDTYVSRYRKSNIINNITNHNVQNLGIVKNLNKAIQISKGNYLIVLAIDDLLYDEEIISVIVNLFITQQCLIMTGFKDTYDEAIQNFIKRFPSPKATKIIEQKDPLKLYRRICFSNFISGAATPFSREFIIKYGYFDESYVLLEDYPKYLKITRENCSIGFLKKPIIKYRLGGISTKSEINQVFTRDIMKAIETEILPYKANIGFFLYRLNQFKLERFKRELQGKKGNNLALALRFFDAIVYRAVMKFFW